MLQNTIEKVINNISDIDYDFELILVDDGSKDGTDKKIAEIVNQFSTEKYKIKGLIFSRNFGHQYALEAGMKNSIGDSVITIDADLEHPPELIPKLITSWEEGNKIVNTVRKDTAELGLFKRFTSALFYRIYNFLTGFKMIKGTADFKLYDREIVEVINSIEEKQRFYRGIVGWIGFKQAWIEYTLHPIKDRVSRYTLSKMINFSIIGITSFSTKPLYLASVLGIITLLFSIFYGMSILILKIAGYAAPGQASIIITIIFFSSIIMLLLGVMGIYIAQLIAEVKKRPTYLIKDAIEKKD